MFFRFDIGGRARSASRLIGDIRSDIVRALLQEKSTTGLTQQQLAQKIGVSRSELNRSLAGKHELSLRSIANLAWALNKEVSFELRDPVPSEGQNYPAETSTAATCNSYIARSFGDHAEKSPSSSGAARTFFARQLQDGKD